MKLTNETFLSLERQREKEQNQTPLRRFLRHKLAFAGSVFLIFLLLVTLFAPFLAPYPVSQINADFEAPPSAAYILGTDSLGRDILSRLIYAGRVSILVGFVSVLISVLIGIVAGLVAGYCGGLIDAVIMRTADIFLSFPQIMIIMVVVSIVGPGIRNLIIVMGVLGWPQTARLVRSKVLSIKTLDYVRAGQALGFGPVRILFRHILPNTSDQILVNATFAIANAVLSEASLSFLGLGVQPPTPSWGNMLSDAQSLTILSQKPWMWVPAGLLIMLTTLSVNFVGDGLRDLLDPYSRH